jgi:hypothetical protein
MIGVLVLIGAQVQQGEIQAFSNVSRSAKKKSGRSGYSFPLRMLKYGRGMNGAIT